MGKFVLCIENSYSKKSKWFEISEDGFFILDSKNFKFVNWISTEKPFSLFIQIHIENKEVHFLQQRNFRHLLYRRIIGREEALVVKNFNFDFHNFNTRNFLISNQSIYHPKQQTQYVKKKRDLISNSQSSFLNNSWIHSINIIDSKDLCCLCEQVEQDEPVFKLCLCDRVYHQDCFNKFYAKSTIYYHQQQFIRIEIKNFFCKQCLSQYECYSTYDNIDYCFINLPNHDPDKDEFLLLLEITEQSLNEKFFVSYFIPLSTQEQIFFDLFKYKLKESNLQVKSLSQEILYFDNDKYIVRKKDLNRTEFKCLDYKMSFRRGFRKFLLDLRRKLLCNQYNKIMQEIKEENQLISRHYCSNSKLLYTIGVVIKGIKKEMNFLLFFKLKLKMFHIKK